MAVLARRPPVLDWTRIAAIASAVAAVGGLAAYLVWGRTSEEDRVRRVYAEVEAAMAAGDVARLRDLTTETQRAELDAPDAVAKLQLMRALSPTGTTIESVKITGAEALITARGSQDGAAAVGRIELTRQRDGWKVRRVAWNLNMTPPKLSVGAVSPPDPRHEPARPADWPQLVGTWKGKETRNSNTWTVEFAQGYRLAARSDSGESYAGEAKIRWDLGVENDRIHMPPGWAPLDVEIAEAAHPQAVGKVALAAFSLSGGELKLCGGAPGSVKRVRSFESPGAGFRCMVLTRAGSAAPATATETPPAAPPPPGEATLLLDGVAERYVAKTGFFSETRLAEPTQATLHFELPAPEHSNARRIVITLDATKTGRHYAHGEAIHDQMFNDKPIKIGEATIDGHAANFRWGADGGQHFPPKRGTGCAIDVVSPYTGSATGEFVAEMAHCLVHSAGIDRDLSAVTLRFKGTSER